MTFDVPKTNNKQNSKHSSNDKKYYKKSGDIFSQLFKSNNQPKKVFASEDDKIQFVNAHCYDEHVYKKTYPKQSTRKYSRDSDNYSTSNEDYPSSTSNHFKSKADDFKIKYKTELCKYFEINGYCKFGDNVSSFLYLCLHIQCAYAHGKENLRSKVTKTSAYRTKKCVQFFEYGFCPYGNRCQFAHAFKSNILNNPYEKDITYGKMMKTFSKIENVENIKTFNPNKKRLAIFESIVTSSSNDAQTKRTLFDDIKELTKDEILLTLTNEG